MSLYLIVSNLDILDQLGSGVVTDPIQYTAPITFTDQILVDEGALEVLSGEVNFQDLNSFLVSLGQGKEAKFTVDSNIENAFLIVDSESNQFIKIKNSLIGGKQFVLGSTNSITDLVGLSFRINGDDVENLTATRLNELLNSGVLQPALDSTNERVSDLEDCLDTTQTGVSVKDGLYSERGMTITDGEVDINASEGMSTKIGKSKQYILELSPDRKTAMLLKSNEDIFFQIDTSIVGGKQILLGAVEAVTDFRGLSFRINGEDISENLTAARLSALLDYGLTSDEPSAVVPEKSTVTTTDATSTTIALIEISDATKPTKVLAELTARRSDGLELAAYKYTAILKSLPASGVLTVSGVPSNGDQVEIDGKTYTFETVLTDADGNVLIGGTAEASIDNLVAAINLDAGAGSTYAASTTVHPTFTARKDSASTMEVVAKTEGTSGNSASTTDPVDGGGVLSWGAATASGGSAMFASENIAEEYESDAAWSVGGVATSSGLDLQVNGTADKTIEWTAWVRTFVS